MILLITRPPFPRNAGGVAGKRGAGSGRPDHFQLAFGRDATITKDKTPPLGEVNCPITKRILAILTEFRVNAQCCMWHTAQTLFRDQLTCYAADSVRFVFDTDERVLQVLDILFLSCS